MGKNVGSFKRRKILEVFEVSKSYNMSNSKKVDSGVARWTSFKDAISDQKKNKFQNKSFFALEDVSFEIKKSESLGIRLKWFRKKYSYANYCRYFKSLFRKVYVRGKVVALLELGSGFNPDFTGKENIIINGKIFGLTESEIKSKLQSIQNFAEIGDFFHQAVSTYSNGMVLRLAFAVLAHINPDILIIDEALAVGDAKFQLKCFTFLEEFKNKGGTLILVSHDLNSNCQIVFAFDSFT